MKNDSTYDLACFLFDEYAKYKTPASSFEAKAKELSRLPITIKGVYLSIIDRHIYAYDNAISYIKKAMPKEIDGFCHKQYAMMLVDLYAFRCGSPINLCNTVELIIKPALKKQFHECFEF